MTEILLPDLNDKQFNVFGNCEQASLDRLWIGGTNKVGLLALLILFLEYIWNGMKMKSLIICRLLFSPNQIFLPS